MKYSEKLRDPRLQKKRLEILQRDGWKCLFCGGDKRNLQVHHVIYGKRDPWDYPDYLYQTLCCDCHELRQELTDKIVSAIRVAIKDVPTQRLTASAQKICSDAKLQVGVGV